jgi:predicted TIM-barrel fold metal-dependent hydrolase
MRTIAPEEHCLTPELRELLGPQIHPDYAVHRWPPALETRLMDLSEGRIAEMDAHGIDVQVLSMLQPGLEHGPADRAVPAARAFNDRVAAAIAAHPGRFAGFAALPTADPTAAADELARAVRELGFKGALVNGRTLERFLDDQFFWPMFESAAALGVPIYLHRMPPPQAVYDAYYTGFGDAVGFMLGAPAWGWHIETGLHALRLILAGVFDRFPRLQLINGHVGEVIPFMLARIDDRRSPRAGSGQVADRAARA